ncbi:MAG: hypothetical protein KF908_02175 [Nitrosomonas sp.]|nr:hypothetical protein [Nitrosomonas sp.]MCW5606857.1 hypothetical protein [Nitrosomonas sp.]
MSKKEVSRRKIIQDAERLAAEIRRHGSAHGLPGFTASRCSKSLLCAASQSTFTAGQYMVGKIIN